MSELAPSELLDHLLVLLCGAVPFSQVQLANLEALRGHVNAYEGVCCNQGEAATHPGCLCWLKDMKPKQAEGGDNAVHVLTYHRAKGLEWPVVVLYSLDEKLKDSLFGLHTESAEFDPQQPLAGRSLQYWPNFWGKSKPDWDALKEPADKLECTKAHATAEELRLLYVGMTRARDALILVGLEDKDMEWLTRSVALLLPKDDTGFAIGSQPFPVVVQEFSTDSEQTAVFEYAEAHKDTGIPSDSIAGPVVARSSATQSTPVERPPSATPALTWTKHTVGKAVSVAKEARGTTLGTALHAWFAVDLPGTELLEARLVRAARHVALWHMPLAPEVLTELSTRLKTFMEQQGTGTWRTEWPLAALHEIPTGSRCRHFSVDALFETPAAYHIIDHKTDFLEETTEKYLQAVVNDHAQQLLGYKSILEALGSTTKVWVYLALEGIVVEVGEGSTPDDNKSSVLRR